MELVDILNNLDAILDRYGITKNGEAIKDEIYWEVIDKAYHLGYDHGIGQKPFQNN